MKYKVFLLAFWLMRFVVADQIEDDKVLVEMDHDAFDIFHAMMKLNQKLDPNNHHRVLKGGKGGGGKGKSKSFSNESSKTAPFVLNKEDTSKLDEEEEFSIKKGESHESIIFRI
jgi:hypothetical protein